jgi:hypothetical protein
MTNTQIGMFCCLLLSLAGCAQIPDRASRMPGEEPAIGGNVLLLNPGPGTYSRLDVATDTERDYDMDLTIVRPNPDTKWAPLGSFCVMARDSKQNICLRFIAASDTGNIRVRKTVGLSNEKPTEDATLPGLFHYGDTIHVRFRSAVDHVDFTVNGTTATYATSTTADRLSLICSSAFCRFRL